MKEFERRWGKSENQRKNRIKHAILIPYFGGKNMKKIRLDQFTEYRFCSNLQAGPKPGTAAFVVTQANGDNGYDNHLWLLEDGHDIVKHGVKVGYASPRKHIFDTEQEMRAEFNRDIDKILAENCGK